MRDSTFEAKSSSSTEMFLGRVQKSHKNHPLSSRGSSHLMQGTLLPQLLYSRFPLAPLLGFLLRGCSLEHLHHFQFGLFLSFWLVLLSFFGPINTQRTSWTSKDPFGKWDQLDWTASALWLFPFLVLRGPCVFLEASPWPFPPNDQCLPWGACSKDWLGPSHSYLPWDSPKSNGKQPLKPPLFRLVPRKRFGEPLGASASEQRNLGFTAD